LSILSRNAHPLSGFSLKFRGFKSFRQEYCDLGVLSPINVIIGRNNIGKSSIISLLKVVESKGKHFEQSRHGNSIPFELVTGEKIVDETIKGHFPQGTSGGPIPGDHYEHGKRYLEKTIFRQFTQDWKPKHFKNQPAKSDEIDCNEDIFARLNNGLGNRFTDFKVIVIPTERKVVPEVRDTMLPLGFDGAGITNLVRAFLNHDNLRREEVSVDLLADLNKVYLGDTAFREIYTQENQDGFWEIFLTIEDGSAVRLSESGSSLQSTFIILCLLRLGHEIKKIDWSKVVLCVEEPENNMHPSLLRRLLEHLADERRELQFTLIITSHSPVCIDWATKRNDSKLIHVFAENGSTKAQSAPTNKERRKVLDDLDIRASDILQSNGIIWVEGPSDRIYIRKWIELSSDGELREDIHFSIMFYGGKLLSHLVFRRRDYDSLSDGVG